MDVTSQKRVTSSGRNKMKDTLEYKKARMRQSPSAAELKVFTLLQSRVPPGTFEPLGSAVCYNSEDGLQVVSRERMTTTLWDKCMQSGFVTVPDFTYRPGKLAFYLDGPPHTHSKVKQRDEKINKHLWSHGWLAVRFAYSGTLSDARAEQIVQETVEKVKEQ